GHAPTALSPPYGNVASRRLHALAGEHRRHRKQALFAGARALVVVENFERALAQFEDRHVRPSDGGGPDPIPSWVAHEGVYQAQTTPELQQHKSRAPLCFQNDVPAVS